MQNKCLGVFLVVLTVPLVMLSILQLSTRMVTNPSFYKELLNKTQTYKKLAQNQKTPSDDKNLLGMLTYGANEQWFKNNIDRNIEAVFTFANGKSPDLNVSIPTDLLKKNLINTGQLPPEAVSVFPEELSTKSYAKLIQDLSKMADTQALLAGTPGVVSGEVEKSIVNAKEFDLKFQENSKSGQKFYSWSKMSAFIIYGLTILMLILIAVTARHYPPAIFRWVGEALIIPAAILGIAFLLIQPFIVDFLNQALSKLPAETQAIVNPLVSEGVTQYLGEVQKLSMFVSLAGLIMVVISYILPYLLKPETAKPVVQTAQPIQPR